MGCKRLISPVISLILFLLLLTACGTPQLPSARPSPTPTPLPPTARPTEILPADTPAPELPTRIPTQVFKLAASTDDVAGTWVSGDAYYIRFDKDGTYRQAHALDKLDSQPYAILSYHFEGTTMLVTDISVSGVPSCGKRIGRYEIRLLESGNIRIVIIKEECVPRGKDTALEFEPVR